MASKKPSQSQEKETNGQSNDSPWATPQARLLEIVSILLIIGIGGLLITVPEQRTTSITIPSEQTIVETIKVPKTSLEPVDCRRPDYELVKQEILGTEGKLISLQNKQNEPWTFTVRATFTFTNRTTLSVPPEQQEIQEQTIAIPANAKQDITFYPKTDSSNYENIYMHVLIVPERRECEVDIDVTETEQVVTKTVTNEQTYNVPYTIQRTLWSILRERWKEWRQASNA